MKSSSRKSVHRIHYIGNYAPIDLLKYTGLITWFCAAIPWLFHPWLYPEPLPMPTSISWGSMQLLFGAAYWFVARDLPRRHSGLRSLLLLLVMSGSALLISYISQTAVAGILLLIVAGLIPWMLPLVWGLAWLIGQNVALGVVISTLPGVSPGSAGMLAGMFLGVSLFAYMASQVGLRNIRARMELARLNSQLRATQSLLAENTRIAERVRIARDLHDLVGHHLTALTLNLEVVTHLVEGKALEHVRQAHSLAKLLLADVREVVSEMREDDRVDLEQVLLALTAGVPEPRIHLQVADSLDCRGPQLAQLILRTVQEIVTNTVRHASADNLWIEIYRQGDMLVLESRDDGRGAVGSRPGNGLRGMRERVAGLGGKMKLETSPGEGFAVYIELPIKENSG